MDFIENILKEKESPKTYLEILKVHNKEIPIANLLAFFFRPDEKHGLKYLDENKNSTKNIFNQVILSHFVKQINELYSPKTINNFIFNDFIQTIENRTEKATREKILTDTIRIEDNKWQLEKWSK